MFQSEKPQQDKAYNEMLKPIQKRLEAYDCRELAEKSGGNYLDRDRLEISSLGERVRVNIRSCEFEPRMENWQALVLLHYLCNCDGSLPEEGWISFGDMKDGMVRGSKFGNTSARWFTEFMRNKSLDEMEAYTYRLGGEACQGRGDRSYRIPFLPYFPIMVNFWEKDEEFEASGRFLLNQAADRFLSIEDAVVVGEILKNRYERLVI